MNASNPANRHLALPAQSDNQLIPSLNMLRCNLLALLIGNPIFTKEEQLRANHHTHECECPQRLVLWIRNVRREVERRESVAQELLLQAKQTIHCDLNALNNELHQFLNCPAITCSEKRSIASLAPPSSKLEALTLIGRFYVKALTRNGKLSEN